MRNFYLSSGILLLGFSALAQPTVSINLQPGPVIALPTGAAPSALAVADYNQDNRTDIAVCQRGLNSVGVYLQGAGVSFPSSPSGTYTTGLGPSGVVAVPLGRSSVRPAIDLVAISGPSNLYTLLTNRNDGSGTFTPVSFFNSFGLGPTPVNPQLLARDLNNDGWIEFAYTLAPTNFTGLGGAYAQSLSSPISVSSGLDFYRPGYRPSSLALDDFDRDGYTDVVMTDPVGNVFTMVTAIPTGPTSSQWRGANDQTLPSSGMRPVFVATGDVNGDLLPDVALAHEGSSEITIFLNSRTGVFGTPVSYPLSAAPRQVLFRDLNDDYRPDMLVLTADNKLQVFQHTGAAGLGRYGNPMVIASGANPATMQFADIDADSRTDVVVGCADDNTVRVYLNRSGVLATHTPRLAGVSVYPNPAREQVTVSRTPLVRGPLSATLFNALGQELRHTSITEPVASILVADLPSGVYLLKLSTAEGVMSQRLVIER